MYEDKLDGRIDTVFYDNKAAEYRAELRRLKTDILRHQEADHNYLVEGIKLLELASRARELYLQRSSSEKRQLLDFLCSNSIWKDGKLTVNFRKPFDSIVDINSEMRAEKEKDPQFFAEGLRKGE